MCIQANKRQPKYKKVKSLGNFCQQFIHLFVGWKPVISLEEAARQISDDVHISDKVLKTKIRRLYDIANVLQSIGLIEKTHMSTSRKPAFKWIGMEGVFSALERIKTYLKKKGTSDSNFREPLSQPQPAKPKESLLQKRQHAPAAVPSSATAPIQNKRTLKEQTKPTSSSLVPPPPPLSLLFQRSKSWQIFPPQQHTPTVGLSQDKQFSDLSKLLEAVKIPPI
jgi:hypothetical protein